MAGRISGALKLALSVLIFVAPLAAAAADQDIATLRVSSVNAVLGDLERLAATLGLPVDGDEVLDGAMAPLQLPGLALIDRSRPAALVFPARGLAVGANALAGALPVSDVEAALLLLEERYETHGVNGSTHTFSRSGGTSLVVRAEEGYLVVGLDPTVVGNVDLAAVLGGGDLPPGNISLDIYLEEVAPVVQAGLLQGRQMVQVQMEAAAAEATEEEEKPEGPAAPSEEGVTEEEEAAPDEEGATEGEEAAPDEEGSSDEGITIEPVYDPQALMPVVDLYFDFIRDAINNVSRVQISIEVTGEHLLLHERLSPRAGSTLAGLVAAQSGGFPDLARLVDPEGAMMTMVGQVTRTPEFDAALAGYAGRYLDAVGGLMSGLGDQPFLEQYMGMMDSAPPLVEKWLACYRGDMAATFDIGLESGMRMTQVMGVRDAEACRTVMAQSSELMEAVPAGTDGEPFFDYAENVFSHAGVTANRTEMRFPLSVVEDAEGEEAAELMRAMFGGDRLVTYQGLTGEHMVFTLGQEAEQAFKDVVDRVAAGGGGKGLTEASFAPLVAGPGFLAVFDLGAFLELAAGFAENDEESEEIGLLAGTPGRVVYGARFSGTGLEIDLAFPLETLSYWGKAIAAAAAEDEHEEESGEETEHDSDDEAPEISIEIGD